MARRLRTPLLLARCTRHTRSRSVSDIAYHARRPVSTGQYRRKPGNLLGLQMIGEHILWNETQEQRISCADCTGIVFSRPWFRSVKQMGSLYLCCPSIVIEGTRTEEFGPFSILSGSVLPYAHAVHRVSTTQILLAGYCPTPTQYSVPALSSTTCQCHAQRTGTALRVGKVGV